VGVALAETHGGAFITANRKFCEIFGILPKEAPGLTMREFTPPEDLERDFEAVSNVLEQRETGRFKSEKRYLRRDGASIWVDISLSFVWGERDEEDVHVIVVEDATTRKTAEILRRETEERYRATFENAAVGVALCDTANGKVIQANAKFCEIFGIDLNEAPGTTMMQFTHPEDVEDDIRVVTEIIRERKTELIHTEKRYLRKDGSTFWASFAISLIWGNAGEPDRHIIVLEDITHRMEAEFALRDREAYALSTTTLMGWPLIHSGRILLIRSSSIFGYDS
jgi:PAS domain S-box-containing protein